ncbi:MAG TPA: NAD(P)-dependent oxidoreductase [Xanthobacteraceae bacterium]|nr:NAD(P)-dependent oxidoreductase [Xanthobacteraceae bacterium]
MSAVVCLRPEADFVRAGAPAPRSLSVTYCGPTDASLPRLLRNAQALVIPAVGPKLAPELFADSSLKLVQVTGAGVDRVDPAALRRQGILVANVPGGSNRAVAEYAVTNASVLLRRFLWSDVEIKQGRYVESRARLIADNVRGLDGLLVGIVGFGTIGRAVAEAFRNYGCRICYFDTQPPKPEVAAALEAQPVGIEELLETSDIVSLHVPLLPETTGLIGAPQLARMKPDAILIQASRGGVVDEGALAAALRAGTLGGAAVDVYSGEPPGADNPLFGLDGEARSRILFTPHIAGVTRQSAAFLFRSAWENVERLLIRGEAPLNTIA